MKSRQGKNVRWPGIEPGSNAWKASMLTITPPTLTQETNILTLYTNYPIHQIQESRPLIQGSAWFISTKRQPSRNRSSSWTYRLTFWRIRFKSLRQRQGSMKYGQAAAGYRFRSYIAWKQTWTLKADRWYLPKGHTNEMKRFEDAIVVHYTPKHVVKPGIRVRKFYTGRCSIRNVGQMTSWKTHHLYDKGKNMRYFGMGWRIEIQFIIAHCIEQKWLFQPVVLHRRFYTTMAHDSLPKHSKIDQSIQRLDSNPSNFGTIINLQISNSDRVGRREKALGAWKRNENEKNEKSQSWIK